MEGKVKLKKQNIPIALILILSAILNLANLGIEGYANTFYSAGVKSMLMNFKNFFFASFDPSGFVTIDKPPVGFWIQTIFAKILGFSGWSVILPQAIAGVISVAIIYHLVKKSFGNVAGLVAALCLTVTPISVAAARNNTIDNLLVMFLLFACWAAHIAAEKAKLSYLILSLVLVGIGFNIKMVEAYMVGPTIYITYLFASSISLKKRIKDLIIGTVVLLVVSFSWAVVVDCVPASSRPYIGSSTNNSVIQLIVGHNGLERIGIGGRSGSKIGGYKQFRKNGQNKNSNQDRGLQGEFQDGFNSQNKNRNYGNGMQNGLRSNSTGIFRLFGNGNMSDQISWLLVFAVIGFIAAAVQEKLKAPFDTRKKLSLILWFMWLVPEFIYFSFSKNVTHTYYLTTMAPAIAALAGIGLSAMWAFYKEGKAKAWFLPIALAINGLVQILILSYNRNISQGYNLIIIAIAVLCILPAILLCIFNLTKNKEGALITPLAIIAFVGILIAPTVWSFTPMFYEMNGSSPSAGLELARTNHLGESGTTNDLKLVKYLEENKKNEKYLVMVPSATAYGSDLILKTGEPIMTLGGFSGSDPILTLDKFKALASKGELRYALINSSNSRGFGNFGGASNSNSSIMNWIKENGKLVPDSNWKTSVTANNQRGNHGFGGQSSSFELYDLKNAK